MSLSLEPNVPKSLPIKEYLRFEGTDEDWKDLLDLIYIKPSVTVIIGGKGSGKTGLGTSLTETACAKNKDDFYSVSFGKPFPKWVKQVPKLKYVPNNANCFCDEAWLTLPTNINRSKMGMAVTGLMATAIHQDLRFKFSVQNSYLLMLNAIRLLDVLIIKEPSLFQVQTERKGIDMYCRKAKEEFMKITKRERVKYAYVVSGDYEGMVVNKLPSFWSNEIRKSFRRMV